MPRRMIRAAHIIAYQNGGHRHLRGGVVVWDGNEIVHVGKSFEGEVAETIDATDKIITPGFINTHAHLTDSPLDKSFVEDRGPRQFYLSGLFEFLPARDRDDHPGGAAGLRRLFHGRVDPHRHDDRHGNRRPR